MTAKNKVHYSRKVERVTSSIIKATGTTGALLLAFVLVAIWALSGSVFHYSEKWESTIGTVSSVITILMVFLIQKSQNKDSLAIQLKLK